MGVEFQKRHFEKNKKQKNRLFSNHCLSRLVQRISMKRDGFVWWPFLAFTNKSVKMLLNIFGDTVIQSFKSGKTQNSNLIPMLCQQKLVDLFLVFPATLKT